MSLYATDKTTLMLWVLDHYDVRYKPTRYENQKISCVNSYAHKHGDKTPSASVNIGKGMYFCFGCHLSGDGYTILKELEGWTVQQVNEAFGGNPEVVNEGDVWI